MKNLWERKKGVLIVLALPPLLIYFASTTGSQYGWMVATLYILAGIIVVFILTGGLSSLMTDKEYKEHEKKQRDHSKAIEKLIVKQEKREKRKKRRKRRK